MHDALSRRITKLINASDAVTTAALKTELLDLAKHCQIMPQNNFLLSTVCGPMERAASAVFGSLALLLVMTEPRRRQVYFAVLAGLEANGTLWGAGFDTAMRIDLLTKLVVARNADLIEHAYGACPPGLFSLLSRLGECGREPEIYVTLISILNSNPDLGQHMVAVCPKNSIEDELIMLWRALPATPMGIRVAARFGDTSAYQSFMRPYRVLAKSEEIIEVHMRRIVDGEAPGNLLEDLYLDRPFPPPVVIAPGVTHIVDGHALVKASQEFSNCLAASVSDALNNNRQFYIWRQPDAPDVVFAIDREAPFGWYLSEARFAENQLISQQMRRDLAELLKSHGIRTAGTIEAMLQPYRRDVGFLIDQIVELD